MRGRAFCTRLTGVIARHHGNILSVEIVEERPEEARTYFEIEVPGDPGRCCRGICARCRWCIT